MLYFANMNYTQQYMFKHKELFVLIITLFLLSAHNIQASVERINRDWKFRLGDYPTAKEATYDDVLWSTVQLPHDWDSKEVTHKMGHRKIKRGYASGGIG